MIFNILLFAGVGRVLFGDEYLGPGEPNMFQGGFWLSIYGLFVLQTTVDSPDVYLPYYEKNRAAALYFILFQLLNTILVVNMVLAVFYTSYKAEVEKSTIQIM